MNVMSILKRTYVFVVIRFVVILLTIFIACLVTNCFAKFFFRFFNLHVDGFVYNVFYLNFAVIGCIIGLVIFKILNKTLLFYIKAAHVIAITKLCANDLEGNLILSSFNEIRKRFITINLFGIADRAVLNGVNDIERFVVNQGISDNQNSLIPTGFLEYIIKYIIKNILKTLNCCDEIVLSYVFLQSRIIEESNDELEVHESTNQNKILFLLRNVVDGICIYVKKCIPIMEKTFLDVLFVNLFGGIVSILLVILFFVFQGGGFIQAVLIFIVAKIIFSLINYSFVEPYETITLVAAFYNLLKESDENVDLSEVRKQLQNVSSSFREMAEKVFGDNCDVNGNISDNFIFSENLYDMARNKIKNIFKGE